MSEQDLSSSDAVDDAFTMRSRAHYENHAAAFSHHPLGGYLARFFRHYHRREFPLRALDPLEFSSVLDVGCADGFFVEMVRWTWGVSSVGVDIAPSAIRRVLDVFGAPGAVADGCRLPFPDASFDLVISTETLEHVMDVEGFLTEMRRVARRWKVVTVPVGGDEPPDLQFDDEGHVQNFDRRRLLELFGDRARVESWRCNLSSAFYAAIGRYLGERIGRAFIRVDLALASSIGSESARVWPLRNRSFVVVEDVAARRAQER